MYLFNQNDSAKQSNYSTVRANFIKNILTFCFVALIFAFSVDAARAATYTVTSTADTGGSTCAANCTLRQALTASYFDNTGVINFNIPGGGVKTISPLTPLPEVGHIIDGTTQPGYSGTPLIELNGANVSANPSYGLVIKTNATIRGLIINRFATAGIFLDTYVDNNGDTNDPKNMVIKGNYIGTNAAGNAPLGNGYGIYVKAFNGTVTIGGTGANERNIISGNNLNGINISGCAANQQARIVASVKGNYIGTDAAGSVAVGNILSGVAVNCSDSTIIGGTTAAERNVISGNKGNAGIEILSNDVTIQGNYIGTNAAGNGFLGNTNDGIRSSGLSIIGGSAAGAGNLISGNGGNGIKDTGGYPTQVLGNKIGTNVSGTAPLANSMNGIYMINGSAEIGGIIGGTGNLISGNGDNGIKLEGAQSFNNIIKGNRIGVSGDSQSGIPNTNSGIFIASPNTTVGEAGVAAAQNIIAGNFGDGIRLTGSDAHNNVVENNLIGTNLSGAVLKNFAVGIEITGGAHDNRIGGSNSTAANTIVNSLSDGVQITGSTTINNAIQNNLISANSGLGIDLETDGVNANDADDADAGANNLQNFPVIQVAFPNRVIGALNSQPNKTYTVEFYRNNSCDTSGYGEGQFYLGSQTVMTDANGNAAIDASVALSAGQIISATATDANGNTSEFAQCYTATASPGTLSFSAATYSVNENAGTATISVSRSFGSSGAVSVYYATSNGTAIAGQDYTTASGTLNWANGDLAVKTFTVPITNDPNDEPNEIVNLTLSNPTGGAGLLSSTAVLTIVDDDNPPTISVNDVSKLEGNQGITNFTFNITLSVASGQTIVVDYSSANGTATAGIDYAFNGDTIVFNPGETVKPVTITVNGDTLPELDETFFINLQDPQNATLAKAQGIGTIQDDDNAGNLQFSAANYTIAENGGSAAITVSRTNGAAGAVSVNYSTANGTATAGSDYTAVSGNLVLNDGQTSASFNVPILNDAIGEANETVFLSLANANGGATLGNQTTAILTINDDDGGLPANVFIGGRILENGSPLPNVLVTLSGSQSKTATTDASGNYNFANLPGGGNYLVTPTFSGHTFEPFNLSYNNLAASVSNANFTATTGIPARLLRVAGGDTVSGNAVVVPIELVSQGNENSVGFSLNFDANLLSNAQVSLGNDTANGSLVVNQQTGKLGIIVALPSGQTFVAGNRQVATITFQTAQTALYSTPVTFGDAPTTREVADANANTLPTAYADGAVTFAQGFEADVAPRPTGNNNGTITVADFTQVGKFVAGIDQINPVYNEFQRADCAPKGTKGNGALTVSDYTQAGRYAAGLDVVQTAGGASQLNRAAYSPQSIAESIFDAARNSSSKSKTENLNAARNIRVVNTQASPNSQVLVSIEADMLGDENAFGFSINYDALKLSNPLVSLGTGTQGATLISNTLQTGTVGVVLAFPTGQTIAAGTKQLVTIRFDVAPNALGGNTPLTFSDAPVFREVVNANADPLPTDLQNGAINILSPTAANITLGGRAVDANGNGINLARVTLIETNGESRIVSTNSFGYYRFYDIPAGATYILTAQSKRYTFKDSTRVITANDDELEINFTIEF